MINLMDYNTVKTVILQLQLKEDKWTLEQTIEVLGQSFDAINPVYGNYDYFHRHPIFTTEGILEHPAPNAPTIGEYTLSYFPELDAVGLYFEPTKTFRYKEGDVFNVMLARQTFLKIYSLEVKLFTERNGRYDFPEAFTEEGTNYFIYYPKNIYREDAIIIIEEQRIQGYAFYNLGGVMLDFLNYWLNNI